MRSQSQNLLLLAGLAGLGFAGALLVRSKTRRPPPLSLPGREPAYSPLAERGTGLEDADYEVRPSGAATMRDQPRRWDPVDEASDESFPASDPPATY